MPWFDAAGPGAPLFLLLIPGLPIAVLGLVQLLALPLALGFELRAASRRRQGVPTLWDEWPSVSIIVPARNAAGVIDDCLRSIARTRYARYEVVLVDDGSTDNTAELMAFWAAGDSRIKALRQPGGGRAAARNLGARHAAGDILMFINADATLSRSAVDRMLQGFEDRRTGAVYGQEWPAGGSRGRLLAAICSLGAAMTRRALAAVGGPPLLPGGIEAYPSKVLAEIGPFREGAAGSQLELAWRVRAAGYHVAFAPRARIQAASPSTLLDRWQLRSRRTRGLLHLLAAHRVMTGTFWAGFVLRQGWLVPLVPLHSVCTAVLLLSGLGQHLRDLAGRQGRQGRAASVGSGADRDDDAWRALREAWA